MGSPSHKFLLQTARLPSGWAENVVVTIDDRGCLASLEPGGDSIGAEPISGAAVPGLPNLHSHAFQRGMAGLAEVAGRDEDSFWTWREVMYRFLDRLTPDDVEAIAAMSYVEMLESGFTSVGEFHYLHHAPDGRPYDDVAEMAGRIVAAAGTTGIGLTLLPVFYAHGGFGGAAPAPGQRRFVNTLDGFAALHAESRDALRALPGAVVGVAPHSLRAVTLPELDALLGAHREGPVHIHVAEQTREVDDCLAAHGRRPVDLLFDHSAVDRRWCLVHATHADSAERGRIAAAGTVVGLCPVTEANLGDGVFAADDFRARGGRFGVGTDSNVLISAAEELRTLEYGQRLTLRRRNVLANRGASTGATLWQMAGEAGARALGHAAHGLVPGAPADFVVLDMTHDAFPARRGDSLLDGLVFAGGAVREVYARGRRLVADGRHHARETVSARFRTVITRLLSD